MRIFSFPKFKAIQDDGTPGVGWKCWSYLKGTSTLSATWADADGSANNTNPVILDGSGQASIFLDPAIAYKIILTDENDVSQWSIDGINTRDAVVATTVNVNGQITSTLASGTPPLVVASTDKVVNLNADQLDGADWGSPGSIGATAPGAGAFTTLSSSGASTLASLSVTGAAAVPTADGLTVNSKIVPTTWTVPFYLFGTMVDTHIWIANRACKVVSVKEIHSVVGGAAAAVRPRKITDTSAPGAVASGTVKEITTASFDCTATINTTVTGTLSATASDYTFATGDKLALDASGTMTGLVGILVVEFQAV